MTEQEIEKYINTPVGLALRELVDPLIESGEVVLANGNTVDSDEGLEEYLGTDIPSLPYKSTYSGTPAGCGCLLGTAVETLAQAGSGMRPNSVCGYENSAINILARTLGVTRLQMRAVEAGFEDRPWTLTRDEIAYFNTGRALALHYGLL